MGLDIIVLSNVRRVPKYEGAGMRICTHLLDLSRRNFGVGRTAPIPEIGENEVLIGDECELSFRAGSYSGYNQWREWLAEFAEYPACGGARRPHCQPIWNGEIKKGPFFEPINFSDCEGVIGPDACRKLANDFEDNAGRVAEWVPAAGWGAPSDAEWFATNYRSFAAATRVAADAFGCLLFC